MTREVQTPAKRIVLATDLSGAGDRALDRATDLANAWDAELIVVHALPADEDSGGKPLPSWRRPPDMAALAEQQVRADIRGSCPRIRFHIDSGRPLKVILECVEREHADLLIVGLGRGNPFDGLSRTVDELFRRSPCSMLVVKRRPNGPYRHILVGTDYSAEARAGLEAASGLFPAASMTVMHAYDMPYRNLYLDPSLAERFSAVETKTLSTWMSQAALSEEQMAQVVSLIEHGPPEVMLSAYGRDRGADLTVVGAYERGMLFHMMVRGSGPRIVQAAPTDVLVVRASRDEEEASVLDASEQEPGRHD